MGVIPRFELHWVDLPSQAGHAQAGRRPAVVISDFPQQAFSIVVPVTTNRKRSVFPGTMLVDPDLHNGLSRPGVILGFQIRYLDRRFVKDRIGRLSVEDQAELDGVLAELLGFDR